VIAEGDMLLSIVMDWILRKSDGACIVIEYRDRLAVLESHL
jgi:hypothetical protein